MYERSAIVLERYFANILGLGKVNNLKKNFINYCELFDKFKVVQKANSDEFAALKEFQSAENEIEEIQNHEEKLYKKNAKLEYNRDLIFQDITQSPEEIEKCGEKLESDILKTQEKLVSLRNEFVEAIRDYNDKKSVLSKCKKNRKNAENEYNVILEETQNNVENIPEQYIEIAKEFQDSEILQDIINTLADNGKDEKVPFNNQVITNAARIGFDITVQEVECYLEAYNLAQKLVTELYEGAVSMELHEKTIRNISAKLNFLAAEKEYIIGFLDYERITVIYGKRMHRNLMEEACEKLEKDMEQVGNLYQILLKEVAEKSTKKAYRDLYNKSYLLEIEDKDAKFKKEKTRVNIQAGTVMNSNYWRIEGIKNIYTVFYETAVEVFGKDLDEFEIPEEQDDVDDENAEIISDEIIEEVPEEITNNEIIEENVEEIVVESIEEQQVAEPNIQTIEVEEPIVQEIAAEDEVEDAIEEDLVVEDVVTENIVAEEPVAETVIAEVEPVVEKVDKIEIQEEPKKAKKLSIKRAIIKKPTVKKAEVENKKVVEEKIEEEDKEFINLSSKIDSVFDEIDDLDELDAIEEISKPKKAEKKVESKVKKIEETLDVKPAKIEKVEKIDSKKEEKIKKAEVKKAEKEEKIKKAEAKKAEKEEKIKKAEDKKAEKVKKAEAKKIAEESEIDNSKKTLKLAPIVKKRGRKKVRHFTRQIVFMEDFEENVDEVVKEEPAKEFDIFGDKYQNIDESISELENTKEYKKSKAKFEDEEYEDFDEESIFEIMEEDDDGFDFSEIDLDENINKKNTKPKTKNKLFDGLKKLNSKSKKKLANE